MSYLTSENAQFILQILHRFLLDKYKFRIQDVMQEPQIRKLLQATMMAIYKNNDPQTPIEQLNKQTISDLKEYFKDKYNLQIIPEAPIHPVINNDVPLETIAEEPMQMFSEDSEFMNKIQLLELQRKSISLNTPPPPNAQVPPLNLTTPAPIQNSNPTPNTISTIYMPTPPKIGKEIYIHSWQRKWVYTPSRSSFTWDGKIPGFKDNIIRIACWIGPSSILQKAPSLLIHIQGTSGESQETTLIPFYTCSQYAIYKPPLDSLGYIRMLGFPWKITLKSSDNRIIDIGQDNDYYDKFEPKIMQEHHTLLYCQYPRNYQIGDTIRILLSNNEIYAKILNINSISIEVDQVVEEKGYILNFTQQYSLLLEMTSSEHGPIQL